MYTTHSRSNSAQAVAVATPCCPAPVSAMIPCSLAVYEKDGKTYVARMNVGLLGTLLGGTSAKVFPVYVATDQERMVESALNTDTDKSEK